MSQHFRLHRGFRLHLPLPLLSTLKKPSTHPLGEAPGPVRRQRGHSRRRRGRRLVFPRRGLLERSFGMCCLRCSCCSAAAAPSPALPLAQAPPQHRRGPSLPVRGREWRPGAVGELRRRRGHVLVFSEGGGGGVVGRVSRKEEIDFRRRRNWRKERKVKEAYKQNFKTPPPRAGAPRPPPC